jgi:hypothetical protein
VIRQVDYFGAVSNPDGVCLSSGLCLGGRRATERESRKGQVGFGFHTGFVCVQDCYKHMQKLERERLHGGFYWERFMVLRSVQELVNGLER